MHKRIRMMPQQYLSVLDMCDCKKVYQMFYFDMTCNAKQRKVSYYRSLFFAIGQIFNVSEW